MSNTTIGTVQVILSAQHEKMTKAFGDATKQVAAFKNTVLALVGAWASAATVRAAANFVRQNMEIADALEDQAEQMGITTQALGGMRLAAQQTGMSADKFGTAMGKMQQNMVALSHGSVEVENALRNIGLTVDDLKGKDVQQQMAIIADRFAVTGDASLAAATAVKLFGKAGIAMLPVLYQGSAGLEAAAKDAEALGIALSGVELGQITEAKSVLTQVEQVVQSLGLRITAELSPYITALGHEFLNAARESNGFRAQIAATVEGGVRGAVAIYDTWMRLREVWAAVRIGVMWMADKVLAAADNITKTGRIVANVWDAAWALVQAGGQAVSASVGHVFQQLKLGLIVVLDELGQAAATTIQGLANVAGYVSKELSKGLADSAKSLSETTAEMRKEARQDLVVTGVLMKNAADDVGTAVKRLGAAVTTLPEGSSVIAGWRKNLTENMQAEVGDLQRIDAERLANIAKVEAAIIDVKSQAAKRAEDIEKKKNERITAARNVVDFETIEAERKKNVAILGESSNFFAAIEELSATAAESNRALFYVNRGAAMAQAGINAWMAYSNTLASPALISNPMLAQVFANAQLALGLAAVANIAGENPPGRANGGPVGRGGMYEVNERGPEMLTVGDKSFLMMGGKSGHVTPGGPGGGKPTVEIHVHTPPGMTARTEQSTGEGGAPRIDMIIEAVTNRVAGDIASGTGPVSKTMQSTYGLNRSRGSSR
jgi:hypothetical protein